MKIGAGSWGVQKVEKGEIQDWQQQAKGAKLYLEERLLDVTDLHNNFNNDGYDE